MTSRSTRRAQSSPFLTSIEALLLAQATWEFGAASTNWSLIAKLLSKHPLLSRPKSFFTAQSCHAMYEHLLKEAGLESTEANYIPHAETNLSLAQKHYRSRIEQLRDLIVAEESKFKAILREIEDIQTRIWDTTIQSRPGESHVEKPASESNASMMPRGKNRSQDETRLQDNPISVSTEDGPNLEESGLSSQNSRNHKPTRTDSTFRIYQMQDRDHASLEKLPTSRPDNGHTDQRQEEEEEEEIEVEEENKEEEEETSQGQGELEVDQNGDDAPASPKSAIFSMETESDQPPDVMGKHTSDVEEPVVQARRSTRRRKSSTVSAVSHALVRTRLRARGRATDESQTVESDIDESRDNVSTVDDERTSSPFDPGTSRRRDGKRKASLVDSLDSPQDRKRPREDSEPVEEEEPGPSVRNTRARARNTTKTEEQVALKRFQNVIGMLHSQISLHRNGTIFQYPIKPSEAPDYLDIVKRPMDLRSIKTKVRDGMISNSLEFQRDVYLMFANAMMYNRPGSDVYLMAEDMMLESEAQINSFRTESVRRGR